MEVLPTVGSLSGTSHPGMPHDFPSPESHNGLVIEVECEVVYAGVGRQSDQAFRAHSSSKSSRLSERE
jgi:hypothetical protein